MKRMKIYSKGKSPIDVVRSSKRGQDVQLQCPAKTSLAPYDEMVSSNKKAEVMEREPYTISKKVSNEHPSGTLVNPVYHSHTAYSLTNSIFCPRSIPLLKPISEAPTTWKRQSLHSSSWATYRATAKTSKLQFDKSDATSSSTKFTSLKFARCRISSWMLKAIP